MRETTLSTAEERSRWKRRIWGLAALLLFIAALLAWNTWHEVALRGRDLRGLMVAQARSIADVIAESRKHSLEVYRNWEDEIAERLLNNARWVAAQDAVAPITSPQLERFAAAHNLYRINLFDAEGRRVATSHPDEDHGDARPRHEPRDFFRPILDGRTDTLRIGFKEARFHDGRRFAVAVARPTGGAVVVNVDADEMLAALDRVSPEHLLRGLGEAHGLRYLAIHDDRGRLTASSGSEAIPPAPADWAAVPSEKGLAIREIETAQGPVFEVAQPLVLAEADAAWLRVGLDATPLVAARAANARHAWLRSFVFLVAASLAAGLLLAWQRHDLLRREVSRVRVELEARELEARRTEKLAAMGALASGVAHQIRNPLNTINMIAQQLVRDPALESELRQQVIDVHAESARIENIVQQFLQFARPRPPRPEALDVGETVRVTARAQDAAFSASGIRLAVDTESAPATLDRAFVVEIVENLLRNAREASPRGGRVDLEVRRQDGAVAIRVADEGPGVPEGLRERVFDLYYTTKHGGSGVGLSLVARMASAMGGSVSVGAGAGGKGAAFSVRLPAGGA